MPCEGPVTAPERRSGGPKGGPKVRARVFVEADETPMHVRSRGGPEVS